jgi:arylformamidase
MGALDVSMPLFRGMPAFPGDPVFTAEPSHAIARGDAYNVSALALGSHAGTHVDPPRHFLPDGATVDAIDLDALSGPCHVVDIPSDRGTIGAGEIARVPASAERILFRTANSERWARQLEFFPDYVALDASAADELVGRGGVRLVGIDSLSIESDSTGRFPVHRALLGAGILILEGLLLNAASPGEHHLECLPLRVRDGDGGPARAVLRAARAGRRPSRRA